MKQIFSKIMLSLLFATLLCSSTMHAGLSLMVKKNVHSILKKVGDNSGWLAFSLMIPLLYIQYDEADPEAAPELRIESIVINSSILAFGAVAFSAACNWWASRL